MSDSCAVNGIDTADYNLGLHVAALFIILGVSSFACAFPLLAIRFPVLHVPATALFIARHFGTGVLIATAFVHLLPTAFLSLGNPCLPTFWTQDYPAMPGAIAMAAVFFVAVAEMVFSRRQGLCGGPVELPLPSQVIDGGENGMGRSALNARNVVGQEMEESRRAPAALTRAELASQQTLAFPHPDDSDSELWAYKPLTPEQEHKKALLQCLLLEMGILFHSVFIGMALSVIVGKDFIVLLVAIAFHQTFEGLALGSRIAVLKWKPGEWRPWAMALAYGCTTPIGQAIGLATHTLYNPESKTGLLMVGIMNAISSGLLIFASLVELLAEDFLSERSHKTLGSRKRTWSAGLLVFFGAFMMSLVGAWA